MFSTVWRSTGHDWARRGNNHLRNRLLPSWAKEVKQSDIFCVFAACSDNSSNCVQNKPPAREATTGRPLPVGWRSEVEFWMRVMDAETRLIKGMRQGSLKWKTSRNERGNRRASRRIVWKAIRIHMAIRRWWMSEKEALNWCSIWCCNCRCYDAWFLFFCFGPTSLMGQWCRMLLLNSFNVVLFCSIMSLSRSSFNRKFFRKGKIRYRTEWLSSNSNR